jgi:hypothetical protein
MGKNFPHLTLPTFPGRASKSLEKVMGPAPGNFFPAVGCMRACIYDGSVWSSGMGAAVFHC